MVVFLGNKVVRGIGSLLRGCCCVLLSMGAQKPSVIDPFLPSSLYHLPRAPSQAAGRVTLSSSSFAKPCFDLPFSKQACPLVLQSRPVPSAPAHSHFSRPNLQCSNILLVKFKNVNMRWGWASSTLLWAMGSAGWEGECLYISWSH